jgi:NAD(P)-dependent dehydrogenase (short-subunit alcohol dehydrogenase family)
VRLFRRRLLQSSFLLGIAPADFALHAQQPPRSAFGARSTAEEVTADLDLRGKTALVTGCNSGIGYETMRVLALRGALVLGTARSERKGREACASVVGDARPLLLELADFDSIVECAERVKEFDRPLDILICNAGVLLPEREHVSGLEKQFVVNHLGHFVLVNRLLDRVKAASQGRIVIVSSVSHWSAPPEGIDFDNLAGRGDYDAGRAYGQSKLANGLFSMELARRLHGTNATSNVLHPGIVDTNLFRHSLARVSGGGGRKSVEAGAATSCYLAAHPDVAGVSGHYFEDCNPAAPSPLMLDEDLAARLWAVSEGLANEYLL